MRKSKTICLVLAGDEEGGLEKHFVELSNMVAKKHTVYVVAHKKYGSRFDRNIRFHALDLSKGRKNPLTLYKLRNLIRKIQPDIVHAHANKAVSMIASIRPLLPHTIKTIATLHSTKRKLASFEKYDHVIGVSHEVLKKLQTPRKSVVYNGIALPPKEKDSKFLAANFGIVDKFVICAIGRLETVKNFSMLIRAIEKLDVMLLIVGEGTEEKRLKKVAKNLSLHHRVIFTGHRNDVLDILLNSNLCAITSEREGFSYIMAEALLIETPIVTTDVADMNKILPQEFVVAVNDEDALRKTLQKTIAHYDTALEYFQDSFNFAKENFTLEKMVENTLNVYEKVLPS